MAELGQRAVGLLGVSMGGQGALRLAFKHPDLFQVAAGIAPALDYHEWYGHGYSLDEMYDTREHCRQDTALMHVPPERRAEIARQAWRRGAQVGLSFVRHFDLRDPPPDLPKLVRRIWVEQTR